MGFNTFGKGKPDPKTIYIGFNTVGQGITRQQGSRQYLSVVECFRKKQVSKMFGYLVCSRDYNYYPIIIGYI